MAHTDRDDARWFWHDHFKWNIHTRSSKHVFRGDGAAQCWCEYDSPSVRWRNPYRYESGIPSSWNRDQRKAERGKLRNQIQRARNGRMDWDDMPSGEGKMYRRPYYW